ncbi:hypothetical protein NC651_007638 [Populus alba x Populus x berolinensis]|nr:hypothetical protein NC651_007638 [Populus alba x Populus x berolinensis]
MEWALANLLNHPDVLRKAKANLDAQVGDRLIEESDFAKLHYLQSIISENLPFMSGDTAYTTRTSILRLYHWRIPCPSWDHIICKRMAKLMHATSSPSGWEGELVLERLAKQKE